MVSICLDHGKHLRFHLPKCGKGLEKFRDFSKMGEEREKRGAGEAGCGTPSHSALPQEGRACLRSSRAAEDQLIVVNEQSLGDLLVTPRKRGNICSVEQCGRAC